MDGGGDTSLALDSYNKAHISYYFYESEVSGGHLRYAKKCFDQDADCDDTLDSEDNCPDVYNSSQADTCPPGGNDMGDACECEGNFDPKLDDDVDGSDASLFKADFGRGGYSNPCEGDNPCNGDFDCDSDVDGTDASTFKADFGRGGYNDPCPISITDPWCVY